MTWNWDHPHSEPPDAAWYHPRFIRWIAADIAHITRNYVRQKRVSVRARRWVIVMELSSAMQDTMLLARSDDVPEHRRDQAVRTNRRLQAVAEELGMADYDPIERNTINDTEEAP